VSLARKGSTYFSLELDRGWTETLARLQVLLQFQTFQSQENLAMIGPTSIFPMLPAERIFCIRFVFGRSGHTIFTLRK
jgi:hypothetical protein